MIGSTGIGSGAIGAPSAPPAPGPVSVAVERRDHWGARTPGAFERVDPFALLDHDPVAIERHDAWAMPDTAIRLQTAIPVLTHAGRDLSLLPPLEISADAGSPLWSVNLELAEASDYARLSLGDALTLTIGATTWPLLVDAIAHVRGPDPSYQVRALSALAVYAAPWATPTHPPDGLASAVCAALLGESITWSIPDWALPASAAELEDTPLALVQAILAEAGAALYATPAGSLTAAPQHPVAVPDYPSASATALTDSDLIAHGASRDQAATADRYILTSGDTVTPADAPGNVQLVAEVDPDDPHAYTVRAYPQPWRPLLLQHSGDSATQIGARADTTTTHVERLEIRDGTATLGYPLASRLSASFQYADLGALHIDGRALHTGVSGDSLLNLHYTARCWAWNVSNARVETIQFLLVEEGA
jgi:hypothetical protein